MSNDVQVGKIQPIEAVQGLGLLPDGTYKKTVFVQVNRVGRGGENAALNLVVMTSEDNKDDYAFHITNGCQVPMKFTVKNGKVTEE